MKKREKRLRDECRVFLNLLIFFAEASRGRREGKKNECEGSVWKMVFVNTVRKSNRGRRGRRVSRR